VSLLFDQNLSPRLIERLADIFPGANHVSLCGLERATDDEVWWFAHTNKLTIVTKDADFGDLGVIRGFPPKVIWLRLGNCTTGQIEAALRAQAVAIHSLMTDPSAGILAIF
jgi:predicted nuclease of predicted toxin-antitoxin system